LERRAWRVVWTIFTSNGRQDLVFALPISLCTVVIGKSLWWKGAGMDIALNIALAVVVLYGLTVMFIRLRQELKRNLPCEER
jgi:F0F1-type ATP synthase membrane subunit a